MPSGQRIWFMLVLRVIFIFKNSSIFRVRLLQARVGGRIKPCLSGVERHISLCYVDDIVQAMLLAAQSQQSSGEIFSLSDGQDYRLEEIGDIFAQAMRVNAYCIRVPEWMIIGMASFSEYLAKF